MEPLDDLGLLRTFVRIAESGGISSAARSLGLNQPTVSRRLRQLERTTGVPLVRRDTRTMSLTPAGRRLVQDARSLLELAESAGQQLRGEKESVRGLLRIVAVVDFGQWIVSRLLARFRARHPGITAELHFSNRPVKFIEEGFDCGILVGEFMDPTVTARRVATVERVLVATPEFLAECGTLLRPEDLSRLQWVGIVQPQFYARDRLTLVQEGHSRTVPLSPALLLDGVTGARLAALEGAGFTMQPCWLVRDDLKAGRLVEVLPQWRVPPVPVHVVYPSARVQPARVRAFADFVRGEVESLL